MNLTTVCQGETWMTQEERHLNQEFVQATAEFLTFRGVVESPIVLIRINDAIATWLLARRLETALTPQPGEPAPCPTPAQAGAIGKCRDRLRRAMKDLEACCPEEGEPTGLGLFDRLLQATPPTPETHSATPNEPHEPGHEGPKQPHDAIPAGIDDRIPSNRIQSGPGAPIPTPTLAEPDPTHPPPAVEPPCQRDTRKRRKKRGCPKRPRAS